MGASLPEFAQLLSPGSNLCRWQSFHRFYHQEVICLLTILTCCQAERCGEERQSHIVSCGFKILTARIIGVYGKHYGES